MIMGSRSKSRTGELAPDEGNGEVEMQKIQHQENHTTYRKYTTRDTEEPSQESNDGKIFRIKIFNNNGEVVVNSAVNALNTASDSEILESIKQQLKGLTDYTFDIGNSISLWSTNSNKVKIKRNC